MTKSKHSVFSSPYTLQANEWELECRGSTSKQTRTNGHLHSTRNVSWLSDFGLRSHSTSLLPSSSSSQPPLSDWLSLRQKKKTVSSQFLKCVICFAWWLLSFLMPFHINTFVSICWRCHHYYCHAYTNTSFHNVSAIFMECIFKLFQAFVSERANVSPVFHVFCCCCCCCCCSNIYLFCVIFSSFRTDFK